MPGLTIERQLEIIRRRLEEIALIIRNDSINLENIRNLLEMIESLEARIQNLRNRTNN